MMTLYDAIFTRKSTRVFEPDPLDLATLETIRQFFPNLKRLDPSTRFGFDILGSGEVKGFAPFRVPHYLALYSETKPGYLTNGGFIMQQMDLFLSSKGLATCYLGMGKPELKKKGDLEHVIVLAFGKTDENPHRYPGEFRRMPTEAMSYGDDPRIEAVRLAPSARNSQPWFLACDHGTIDLYKQDLSPIKAALMGRMNAIDMGIALCHLWLASEALGMGFRFTPGGTPTLPGIGGYSHFGRVTE